MNRLLLGALMTGAVFSLTSFTITGPGSQSTKAYSPMKVTDFTLDRATRIGVSAVPQYPQAMTVTMPPTSGFIITSLSLGLPGYAQINISINGGWPETVMIGDNSAAVYPRTIDPPIVVRPGDTLSISAPYWTPPVTLGGYTTLPGET